MPCVSSVRRTKLISADQLVKAATALGLEVKKFSEDSVRVGEMLFSRRTAGDSFVVTGNTSKLIEVQKKYAEVGVREWARKRGYTVSTEGQKLVVQNRRG